MIPVNRIQHDVIYGTDYSIFREKTFSEKYMNELNFEAKILLIQDRFDSLAGYIEISD